MTFKDLLAEARYAVKFSARQGKRAWGTKTQHQSEQDGETSNEAISKAISAAKQNPTKVTVHGVKKISEEVVDEAIFSQDRYAWYQWGGKPHTLQARGRQLNLTKGKRFGIRPATSKNGMYRVINHDEPTKVYSIDHEQVKHIMRNANDMHEANSINTAKVKGEYHNQKADKYRKLADDDTNDVAWHTGNKRPAAANSFNRLANRHSQAALAAQRVIKSKVQKEDTDMSKKALKEGEDVGHRYEADDDDKLPTKKWPQPHNHKPDPKDVAAARLSAKHDGSKLKGRKMHESITDLLLSGDLEGTRQAVVDTLNTLASARLEVEKKEVAKTWLGEAHTPFGLRQASHRHHSDAASHKDDYERSKASLKDKDQRWVRPSGRVDTDREVRQEIRDSKHKMKRSQHAAQVAGSMLGQSGKKPKTYFKGAGNQNKPNPNNPKLDAETPPPRGKKGAY